MMNILTDEEISQVYEAMTSDVAGSCRLIARAIESAVLSKLAEQSCVEPVYIEATCELQNWKWIRVSKTTAEEYEKWGWKIRKIYTEAKLLAAQQNAAHKAGEVMRERCEATLERIGEEDNCYGGAHAISALPGVTLEDLKV